jgi:hypothetical protein
MRAGILANGRVSPSSMQYYRNPAILSTLGGLVIYTESPLGGLPFSRHDSMSFSFRDVYTPIDYP